MCLSNFLFWILDFPVITLFYSEIRDEGRNTLRKRYHLRWLTFNTVWTEVTSACVQHVTYFLNAFNFMVKSFYMIFSLFLIGFVRNPQIIDDNNVLYACRKVFQKVVTVVLQYISRVIEWMETKTSKLEKTTTVATFMRMWIQLPHLIRVGK